MEKTRFGITMGDPLGIGPEVLIKGLAQVEVNPKQVILFGDSQILSKHNLSSELIELASSFEWRGEVCHGEVGQECLAGGKAALSYLKSAVQAIQETEIQGLVTGPVSKAAIQKVLDGFVGHTGWLGEQLCAKETVMSFYGRQFSLALLTHHIPLAQVPNELANADLASICRLAMDGFSKLLGHFPTTKICGVNPHAGEGGLLGSEDFQLFDLVKELKSDYPISGPYPADTLFTKDSLNGVDLVIACYHDQGLIPYKMAHFHEGVNVTFGLPVPRFSVDHGTAFGIAGKNLAHPGSMVASLKLMKSRLLTLQS